MIKCCIFSTNFVGKTFVHTFYIFVTHNTYNYYICAHSLHICIGIITLIKQKSTLKWVMWTFISTKPQITADDSSNSEPWTTPTIPPTAYPIKTQQTQTLLVTTSNKPQVTSTNNTNLHNNTITTNIFICMHEQVCIYFNFVPRTDEYFLNVIQIMYECMYTHARMIFHRNSYIQLYTMMNSE